MNLLMSYLLERIRQKYTNREGGIERGESRGWRREGRGQTEREKDQDGGTNIEAMIDQDGEMERKTYSREIERRKDRETEIWRHGEAKRQRDREAERQRDRDMETQRGRKTEGQRGGKTEGQRDKATERQMDRGTEGQRDGNVGFGKNVIIRMILIPCIIGAMVANTV
jgi:hypothetical protein